MTTEYISIRDELYSYIDSKIVEASTELTIDKPVVIYDDTFRSGDFIDPQKITIGISYYNHLTTFESHANAAGQRMATTVGSLYIDMMIPKDNLPLKLAGDRMARMMQGAVSRNDSTNRVTFKHSTLRKNENNTTNINVVIESEFKYSELI